MNETLIDKLDRATDRAASIAIKKGIPLQLSKNSTMIGSLVIEKNKKGFYNIVSLNKELLFEDISAFDIAVIIAQRQLAGETGIIRKVLQLEEKYSKYHLDMLHYLHCIKGAKKRRDFERMLILEDKFQSTEMLAKVIKDSITIYKRIK